MLFDERGVGIHHHPRASWLVGAAYYQKNATGLLFLVAANPRLGSLSLKFFLGWLREWNEKSLDSGLLSIIYSFSPSDGDSVKKSSSILEF